MLRDVMRPVKTTAPFRQSKQARIETCRDAPGQDPSDNASVTAVRGAAVVSTCAAALVLFSACTTVPGETTAPRALLRDVSERVLMLSRKAEPQCKQHRITTTEILEVRSDGQSAEELWTVEQCGRRVSYVVGFPPQRGPSRSVGFSVRAAP